MLNQVSAYDGMPGRGAAVPAARMKPRRAQAQAASDRSGAACAEKWVASYGDYLFRYALLRLRNRQASEDAVQETFLAALQSYGRFQGRSSEKTWLVNILKHKIIDCIRKASRERSASEEEFDDPCSPKMVCNWSACDPDSAYQGQQFWKTLQASLGQLPCRVAEAFVLREIDGLETDEICRTLGVSRNNLWVMLHRARMSLRQSFEAGGYTGIRVPLKH